MTLAIEISEWFDRGVEKKAKYMIVVCDTFSHEDFPVFCQDDDECKAKIKEYTNSANMSKAMECYDLSLNKFDQLAEHRAWRVPA